MPLSRAQLFDLLDRLGVVHRTVDHPPIMTVEEGRGFKSSMPGGHSKNLFLKDKKDALYLVTAHCDTTVDLVALGKVLGSKGRLSFGRPELMTATLGVAPGAVTPFALANETSLALKAFVFDRAFFNWDPVWFHPLENNASTALAADDLIKFARAVGHEPIVLDAAAPSLE